MIGIFGGTGFIGRNLVEFLTAKGNTVRSFGRRASSLKENDTVHIDFSDPLSYSNYLNELDTVILLVSASVPSTFPNNIAKEVEENVLPYARFLKALEGKPVQHLVYLSSGGAVYGSPHTVPVNETHPRNPISAYGCAKLMIEEAIRTWSLRSRWSYTILRPSNPIGKYQAVDRGQGLVAAAVQAAITGSSMEIWGSGDTLRDYLHVLDLCHAIELATSIGRGKNEIYNVCMGSSVSINQVIDLCEKALKKRINVIYTEQKSYLVKNIVMDCSRIRSDLNWHTSFTVRDGIDDFVSYCIDLNSNMALSTRPDA
ncbi:NAD-dependent epimerase/dehydratase family protein [Nitratireductor thuwali]|uniref:dTDP-4-dehydro-6-deoxyglucose reductase n=1 Tax=Nitratireductor thuwali TaxID=2267699 RepID=A0ABY5MLW8_9HYPH|nr:dTDP-4-dehydro-6-deoxyglucose reductase [Nitratireductor thuwali]